MKTVREMTVCVSCLLMASAAHGETETQSFDSAESAAAAGWVAVNTTVEGNDYGWSDSANAGGVVGEAGGTVARATTIDYYADTSIGELTLDDFMTASGKFLVTNLSADYSGGHVGRGRILERGQDPSVTHEHGVGVRPANVDADDVHRLDPKYGW